MEFECMSGWPRTPSAGDYWEKTLPYVRRMATSHRYSRGSQLSPALCLYCGNVSIPRILVPLLVQTTLWPWLSKTLRGFQ